MEWNQKINLVSRHDIDTIFERHILDSLQILYHETGTHEKSWMDIGSGGGLPGLVIAIVRKNQRSPESLTCVESDKRKCAFLRVVSQQLALNTVIENTRVEHLSIEKPQIISARAFASIEKILTLAGHLITSDTTLLLLKGKTWRSELEIAKKNWSFTHIAHKSLTDDNAALLKITSVKRLERTA